MIGEVRFSEDETASVLLEINGEEPLHLEDLCSLSVALDKVIAFMKAIDCVVEAEG